MRYRPMGSCQSPLMILIVAIPGCGADAPLAVLDPDAVAGSLEVASPAGSVVVPGSLQISAVPRTASGRIVPDLARSTAS